MLTGVKKRKIDILSLALPDDRGHLGDFRSCANNNPDHMRLIRQIFPKSFRAGKHPARITIHTCAFLPEDECINPAGSHLP
jgi:hypothetical protein